MGSLMEEFHAFMRMFGVKLPVSLAQELCVAT
jgi:hypothetical protein